MLDYMYYNGSVIQLLKLIDHHRPVTVVALL